MADVWLVRHGETAWSRDRRHTSVTDLPLTEVGVEAAHAVGRRLTGHPFDLVLTSPRARARDTAALAGFPDAIVDDDLAEWAYGSYEGLTTEQIRETVPGWTVWTHPSPGGETAADVQRRVDRVIGRARAVDGDVLLFGHAHALRVLAARWIGLEAVDGRRFRLETATISTLGYERTTPVVLRWST